MKQTTPITQHRIEVAAAFVIAMLNIHVDDVEGSEDDAFSDALADLIAGHLTSGGIEITQPAKVDAATVMVETDDLITQVRESWGGDPTPEQAIELMQAIHGNPTTVTLLGYQWTGVVDALKHMTKLAPMVGMNQTAVEDYMTFGLMIEEANRLTIDPPAEIHKRIGELLARS